MTVLRTDHLAKTYVLGFFRKKIRAISDVTLGVEPGEIFGLLGPNGAGKTTTLKIITGLIRASSGLVTIFDLPPGDVRVKRRLGYLPESPYFYDYLTGRELLTFTAKLFRLPNNEARKRTAALLEKVDLSHAADLALRRYSKGMLQRIGIAQALINDPELVILDEPMTGLDPIGRKDMRELIADLRDQGKTVIFSSHILADVELLANRVAILVRGRTVDTGPLKDLLNAQILNTEIVVSNLSNELQAALDLTGYPYDRVGDTIAIKLEGGHPVEPTLELIIKHRGKVEMVTPRKESLEDLVVQQVNKEHKNQKQEGDARET